jgi:hypothetical protein
LDGSHFGTFNALIIDGEKVSVSYRSGELNHVKTSMSLRASLGLAAAVFLLSQRPVNAGTVTYDLQFWGVWEVFGSGTLTLDGNSVGPGSSGELKLYKITVVSGTGLAGDWVSSSFEYDDAVTAVFKLVVMGLGPPVSSGLTPFGALEATFDQFPEYLTYQRRGAGPTGVPDTASTAGLLALALLGLAAARRALK